MHDAPQRQSHIEHIDQFLALVRESGLVDSETLAAEMREFHAEPAQFGHTITGACAFLIARGLLSAWQVEMLRAGRFKGFFFADRYWLLDCLGPAKDPGGAYYLAEDTQMSSIVVLEIVPRMLGRELHRVVDTVVG